MHSFIERSLVGLAYAAVWIITLLYSPSVGYPILVFVIAFMAAFEMLKLYQIRSFALTILLCLGTASLLVFNAPLLQIAIISFVCQMGLAVLLFRRKTIQAHPLLASIICIAHLLFPLLLISEVSIVESPVFTIELTFGLLFFIWGADAMAYSFGTLFGKTPLFRVVSPKKSIEGALAAILFSPVVALINHQIFSSYSFSFWLLMGIIISITSIVGDLVQSQCKRTAAVKDSGTVLLGHGGVYDRIDSLIFTVPFVYLYLLFFSCYVS
ncbi:MAG: phosphatidate cytidylyltransferase [Flavobacteriaceae bacterium]